MENKELIKLAMEAKGHAYAPFSKFNVGAAIYTKSGKVYTGANMECSSYGLSVCAERVALLKALYDGEKEFEKIAVVAGKGEEMIYTTPCGACRQFLADFNIDLTIICGYIENGEIKEKIYTLKELIPESFKL